MSTDLEWLSNKELLISCGLSMSSDGDNRYYSFIHYWPEMRRRGLRLFEARRASKKFIKQTHYPKRGWENKYLKIL